MYKYTLNLSYERHKYTISKVPKNLLANANPLTKIKLLKLCFT